MGRLHRVTLGIGLVVVALAACDGGSTAGDPDAGARLEDQRTEVRATALDVAPALAAAVGGRVTFMSGEWQGCNIVEQYLHRNFRYSVSGRIDAAGLDEASVEVLSAALEQQGFRTSAVEPVGSGRIGFGGERDGLEGGGTLYVENPFVLFGFSGPCIDVPKGERETWERRRDPDKDLVPKRTTSGG